MVLLLSRFVVLVIAGYLHCPDTDVAMIAPSAASIGAPTTIRTPFFCAEQAVAQREAPGVGCVASEGHLELQGSGTVQSPGRDDVPGGWEAGGWR